MVIHTCGIISVFVLISQHPPKQGVAVVLRTVQARDGSLRPRNFSGEEDLSL